MNARLRSLPVALVAAVVAPFALAQPLPSPPPLQDDATRARPPAMRAPLPPALPADTGKLEPPIAQPPLPTPQPGVLRQNARGAEASGGESMPSRWQSDLNQLDADLRLRLLTADAPPGAWLAGELDKTDIASQVRHYADARTLAPQERLYQASLAAACLVPVRPHVLAPCDAVDRLADWARRDGDNGVPAVLLADRARLRGEPDSAASYVEEAAGLPRFDDYWSRGALQWWNYLQPLALPYDSAVKAKAAANYAASRELPWAASLHGLCIEQPGARSERMKTACARLGDALMTRAATFALRRAGAEIADANATDPAARAAAQSSRARILSATANCSQAQPDFPAALESPDAAIRARGVEEFGTWASAQARDGEVGACQRLAAK